MKFREILQYEKENMPSYQWNLEKFLLVFLIVWLGGALVVLVSGLLIGFLITDEGLICFIPEFIWFGVLAVMLVLLVVKTTKVKAKLRAEIVEKLTNEFYIIDYQEAKQKLIEQNIITEEGFINNVDDEPFDSEIIPFEQARITFDSYCSIGKLFLNAVGVKEGDLSFMVAIDNYYYNFLLNNIQLVSNKKVFALLRDDKQKFARLLVRYNSVSKIEKKL